MADPRPGPPQWQLLIPTAPQDRPAQPPRPTPSGFTGAPFVDRPAPPLMPAAPKRHGDPQARHPLSEPGPSAGAPAAPPAGGRRRSQQAPKNWWHWLLWIPILVPLMPAIYNRVEPTFLGVPFFYWGQLSFAFLASGVIALVHRKVK